MGRKRMAAVVGACAASAIGALAVTGAGAQGDDRRYAGVLRDGDGDRVGTVTLTQRSRVTQVDVTARGLSRGFHGFHVHERGVCDGPSFESAGGHVARSGQDHGDHVGDLPVLLVRRDRRTRATAYTDRFTIDGLRDSDGSAVMIHADPDNYGNVPGRYGRPDKETRDTGDAGDRVACAVVR